MASNNSPDTVQAAALDAATQLILASAGTKKKTSTAMASEIGTLAAMILEAFEAAPAIGADAKQEEDAPAQTVGVFRALTHEPTPPVKPSEGDVSDLVFGPRPPRHKR